MTPDYTSYLIMTSPMVLGMSQGCKFSCHLWSNDIINGNSLTEFDFISFCAALSHSTEYIILGCYPRLKSHACISVLTYAMPFNDSNLQHRHNMTLLRTFKRSQFRHTLFLRNYNRLCIVSTLNGNVSPKRTSPVFCNIFHRQSGRIGQTSWYYIAFLKNINSG